MPSAGPSAAVSGAGAAAPGFTVLRVARVEPLTDDSVAITFQAPDEQAERFRFAPGQHLTLRREVDGQDVRRTCSVCSSAGGPLRVAVKKLEGGAFSGWATSGLAVGDEIEVLPPAGRFGPASTRLAVAATGSSPPAAASRRSCRSRRPCWTSRRPAPSCWSTSPRAT